MSALPSIDRADRAVVGADAAGALYERYGSRIFAFCLSRLGNREEAEDATQTTFLNAFRSLHDGLVPRFELAWLFRIADNVCRDRRKSAWRRGRMEAVHDLQELQDVVSAPERRTEGLVGLQAALAAMPERQRHAILLREWQGLSYGEIAAELRLSKAAVETLIFRARRSLARGLEAPQVQPRRARAGFELASLGSLVKGLLSGAGAAKVAAVAAGVGLIVAAPLGDTERGSPPTRKQVGAPATRTADPDVSSPVAGGAVSRRGGATPEVRRSSAPAQRGGPEREASLPRAAGTAQAPAGKGGEATSPDPTPSPPASAPGGSAPAGESPEPSPSPPPAPPASLPSLPMVPELPPVVPEVPPVQPPAVPPPPDLPVDVPDLPDLPGLP